MTGGARAQCTPEWTPELFAGPHGPDGPVRALAAFEDGAGAALYVAGEFAEVDGLPAANIARWNGREWSAVGTGTNGLVTSLAVYDDGSGEALYVGGWFTLAGGHSAPHIARWNGEDWKTFSWTDGAVDALAVYDDGAGPGLYVGGRFISVAGGLPARFIARWDGGGWETVGEGLWDAQLVVVGGMAVFEDSLYVGGFFDTAGGVSVDSIARWNGRQWSAVGGATTGARNYIWAVEAFDDGVRPSLYVGGQFSAMAGVVGANQLARWDGSTWSPVGGGIGLPGAALALHTHNDGTGDSLYVGGEFSQVHGTPGTRCIARWDGAEWSTLGDGVNSAVRALATFDDGSGPALFVGGDFTDASGASSTRIARWGCALCLADCDRSGSLDFFDFLCFQNLFAAGHPYADCDGSGALDFFDFLCFQNEFAAGCP